MHTILETIRFDIEGDFKCDRLDGAVFDAVTDSSMGGNRFSYDALAGNEGVYIVALRYQLTIIIASSSDHEWGRSYNFAPFTYNCIGGLIWNILGRVRGLN